MGSRRGYAVNGHVTGTLSETVHQALLEARGVVLRRRLAQRVLDGTLPVPTEEELPGFGRRRCRWESVDAASSQDGILTVVLPDTSVWQRRSQREVANAVAAALERYVVAIVDPVELELLRSAFGARDHDELRREYAELRRIPLTAEIGQRALGVQGALAQRGCHRGPSATDLLAAAAAEQAGAELWHCDRHFELIADVTGQPIRKVGR